MKKIVFFEKLDFYTFFLSFFYKIFNNSIYYYDANNFFKNDKIKKKLSNYRIEWLNFLNLDCKYFNESLLLRRKLDKKFIEDKIKNNFLVNQFSKTYNLDSDQIEKLHYTLMGELTSQGNFVLESSALILIKKFFPINEVKIKFFAYEISTCLLLKVTNDQNIQLKTSHFFFNQIYKFFNKISFLFFNSLKNLFKKIFLSKKGKPQEKKLNIDISKFNFAYFPHRNLYYGQSHIRKTFIYENDTNSKLYKEKILTIFFEDTDDLSQRFLNLHKIPNININRFISKKKSLFKLIKFVTANISIQFLIKHFNIYNMILSLFLINFLFTFFKFENFIKKLKSLNLIYSFYDVLFPKIFTFICDINKIKSISHQERTFHYTYFSPLFYNYYLISGDFKNLLPKYDYKIDQYFDMGVMRSHLVNKKINFLKKDLKRLNFIKNEKKVVLCIALFPDDNHSIGLYGEDGKSLDSNVNYLNTIYKLSNYFKLFHFVIRFKFPNAKDYIPKDLIEKIDNSKNIEINNNFKSLTIHELMGLSDIIIGKQTSALEEALSAGKNVIFYDNENHFRSLEYVLNKANIVESNIEGLKFKLEKILTDDKKYLDEILKQTNNFFSINKKIDSYKAINQTIKNLLKNN